MKKSQLKQLIKEVVTQMDELLGEKPKLGQFKWDYEMTIHVKTDMYEYDQTEASKWAPIRAATEEEAKELAMAPLNPKVVTVKNIKMFKRGPVTQDDLDQHDRMSASIAHQLRPKDQGGWGADESVLKEGAFTISPEHKKFADEIIDAAVNKTRGREPMLQDLEAVRTVIKFKLAQEGWRKVGTL